MSIFSKNWLKMSEERKKVEKSTVLDQDPSFFEIFKKDYSGIIYMSLAFLCQITSIIAQK